MAYKVDLPSRWIDGVNLEIALSGRPGPLQSFESAVHFMIPSGAALMVDAGVRLLSISNQLNLIGKRVTLEFCREDTSTYDYLNRIGFFDALHPGVLVRPERPSYSAASRYQGANKGLVEIARLRPDAVDKSLPSRLEAALTSSITNKPRKELVGAAAFALFSELVGNVYEHSGTQLDGYAVLQVYKNGNSAKIAVSDSGKGLLDTLKPSLPQHYPRLVGMKDTELLVYAFREGISRHGRGHGAGLKLCADHAIRLFANLEVRLPMSCVRLTGRRGELRAASTHVYGDMPLIWGTHLVFDFRLD
jgi:hypothetical protein